MTNTRQKLTLAQPARYRIKVPGYIGESLSDWVQGMTIALDIEDDGSPITIMAVTVDQAGLQGLLRRLYGLGLPLISVNWIE